MSGQYVVYGAKGSGSVAVEAALTLLDLPYRVVEAAPWGDEAQRATLARVSPLGQVPVLDLPSGQRMTESAAMLIWLADTHPHAGLAPAPAAPERPAFLRWMTFIPAAVYAMYTVRDEPSRWVDDPAAQAQLNERAIERIRACWRAMEAEIAPAPHLLGGDLSMLDLYVAVVSRWRPGRAVIASDCPKLGTAAALVDADPRLAPLWAERFPFAA